MSTRVNSWKNMFRLQNIGAFVLVLILAVIGYSAYVAVRGPDPQDTVVLGQTELFADSPAGFRVLFPAVPTPNVCFEPMLHARPAARATSTMRRASVMPPTRASLIVIMSAAFMRATIATSAEHTAKLKEEAEIKIMPQDDSP